jgi:hypothetical protein
VENHQSDNLKQSKSTENKSPITNKFQQHSGDNINKKYDVEPKYPNYVNEVLSQVKVEHTTERVSA